MKNFYYSCSTDLEAGTSGNPDIISVDSMSRLFMTEDAMHNSIRRDIQQFVKQQTTVDPNFQLCVIKEVSPHVSMTTTELGERVAKDPEFIDYLASWADEIERLTIIKVDEPFEKGELIPDKARDDYLVRYSIMTLEDDITLPPLSNFQNINSSVH